MLCVCVFECYQLLSLVRGQELAKYLGALAKYLGKLAKYLGALAKYLGALAKYLASSFISCLFTNGRRWGETRIR